jgi:hypothetical protein
LFKNIFIKHKAFSLLSSFLIENNFSPKIRATALVLTNPRKFIKIFIFLKISKQAFPQFLRKSEQMITIRIDIKIKELQKQVYFSQKN